MLLVWHRGKFQAYTSQMRLQFLWKTYNGCRSVIRLCVNKPNRNAALNRLHCCNELITFTYIWCAITKRTRRFTATNRGGTKLFIIRGAGKQHFRCENAWSLIYSFLILCRRLRTVVWELMAGLLDRRQHRSTIGGTSLSMALPAILSYV